MDELLREFLTETNESLDRVDAELVRFEQEPNNSSILGNIFRLVHTIKGTCGFLGLPRLGALAHAAETLIGKFRDGMPVTTESVTLVLSTIDRIKTILNEIEAHQHEPAGNDGDLIGQLNRLTHFEEMRPQRAPSAETSARPQPAAVAEPRSRQARADVLLTVLAEKQLLGRQVLGRALRRGARRQAHKAIRSASMSRRSIS